MKTYIITGASDGLGKAFGELCAGGGHADIICLSRHKPDYDCTFIKCDLLDPKSIDNAVLQIVKNHSKFDALINCAGVPCIQPTNNTPYEELERVMKVNSIAPMYLISKLFDLIKQNEADILNVGSTVGLKAGPVNQVGYTTSKWAIRGTSANLQNELKNTQCRVIQFNAGGMNTHFNEKYNGEKVQNPKEWIDPNDMAKVMLQVLQLPKSIEISEIAVNRKNQK